MSSKELDNPITLQLRNGKTHPSLDSPDLKYDLASQQRKPIATEQLQSRCSSIRTDPSHQALHPKSNCIHTCPSRTRLEHCYSLNQPNQHSSQPIRNHNTISRNDRDNNSSFKPEKRTCSQLLKKDTIIHPPLQEH